MAFKLTNFNYRLILTAILTRSLILRVFILHEILSRVNSEALSAGSCSNKQPANTKGELGVAEALPVPRRDYVSCRDLWEIELPECKHTKPVRLWLLHSNDHWWMWSAVKASKCWFILCCCIWVDIDSSYVVNKKKKKMVPFPFSAGFKHIWISHSGSTYPWILSSEYFSAANHIPAYSTSSTGCYWLLPLGGWKLGLTTQHQARETKCWHRQIREGRKRKIKEQIHYQ